MTTFVGAPSGDAARTQWKWFMAFGVVLAVLGLVALFNAVDAALITTVFVGFVLLIGRTSRRSSQRSSSRDRRADGCSRSCSGSCT